MCDPTTIAVVSIASTVASGAMSVAGQIQQGNAANDAAKYQAAVAKNNAIMADRSAKDAIQRGSIAESQDRLRTRLRISEQKAAFASRGVDLSSASVADVLAGTAEVGELDALTERSNAAREAQGFRVEGANYRSQAQLARAQGQNAQSAATLGAVGTALGTGASVAGKWYDYGMGNPFASKSTVHNSGYWGR